jgi:hypothetical protein
MVNEKFCCDVLRRLRENIRHKHLDKWCNNSWGLRHDNAPAHMLVAWQFLASAKITVMPQPLYSPDLTPCDFSYPPWSWIWSSRGDILTALNKSTPNHRMW